ncbi:hypothetical protein PTKIN_Ptkin14bG0126700 [Pterospermum kingtungense]
MDNNLVFYIGDCSVLNARNLTRELPFAALTNLTKLTELFHGVDMIKDEIHGVIRLVSWSVIDLLRKSKCNLLGTLLEASVLKIFSYYLSRHTLNQIRGTPQALAMSVARVRG